MKKLIIIVLIFIVAISCSNNKNLKKESITVSILPQKYFVEQIAGTKIPVNVMLPPGASPADYEPTPKQIQELANSGIYFFVGHLGFEKSWMKRFSEAANDVKYISCSKRIDLLRGVESHIEIEHKDDEHNHKGTDPHIWTSPENVKTISRTIFNTLSEAYPSKKELFKANLEIFISKIDTLDNYIRANINDSIVNSFMIFHPSLSYYARDYNLEQLSIEFEGKSPSPAHMIKMIDLAREKNIKNIFVQSQFETSKANAVAKEIDAQVLQIDPLAEDWLSEMYSITNKLAKAFNN